jgi:lipid-A-disaccharide synthase
VRLLVSAGEASGDMYAAGVVKSLQQKLPLATFYGCAGPKLQALGVAPIIDAANLSVVGLAEVVLHLPRIYAEYRKLLRYARQHPPDAAILTDNPDFHLRLARHLRDMHVPVFYLVAPQVWAWRQGRVKTIRRLVDKLYCLFPFEEPWFRNRGVNATYIGHPLASIARVTKSKQDFFSAHDLPLDKKMIALLPGSRAGEATRHLPIVLDAVEQLRQRFDISVVLATPKGFAQRAVFENFRERFQTLAIKVIENEAWDSMGHADVVLAASGTVTMEAAILGVPMVTYYKVTALSWFLGRRLVKVPFLSMVNLIAERRIVPELIQNDMTPDNIANEAARLLTDSAAASTMRQDLRQVHRLLTLEGDPFEHVAQSILETLNPVLEKMK